MRSKRAQEEMVGFALIMIIVAVILIVFLGFSLNKQEKEAVESYEVESFIQSFLHYTSDCKNNLDFLSIQDLIVQCSNNARCADGKLTCEVLKPTLTEITKESWLISNERPVKGYELNINSFERQITNIKEGNTTTNSKGSVQFLPNNIEIIFTAYY